MTNVLTGETLYFDSTTTASVTGIRRILGIVWTSSSESERDIAADDDLLVTEASGKYIIGKRAEFAGDDLGYNWARPGKKVDGITITTMGGGVCYIYLNNEDV